MKQVPPRRSELVPPNWPEIEDHYRAGIRSLKSIGAQFGVVPSSILKHCRKREITRDLTIRVKVEADRRMKEANERRRTAVEESAIAHADVHRVDEIIDSSALTLVTVQTAHRHDIARARSIVNSLFAELVEIVGPEAAVMHAEDASEAGVKAGDALAERTTGPGTLPLRARVAKDLVETMQRVITMERTTFGMGVDSVGDGRPVVIIHDFTGRRNETWTPPDSGGQDD